MIADQQAMIEKMAKAATPGPQHETLKEWAGDWECSVKFLMDPSQPWQEAKSTATVKLCWTAVMFKRSRPET